MLVNLMKLSYLLPRINQDHVLFHFMIFWTNPINCSLLSFRHNCPIIISPLLG